MVFHIIVRKVSEAFGAPVFTPGILELEQLLLVVVADDHKSVSAAKSAARIRNQAGTIDIAPIRIDRDTDYEWTFFCKVDASLLI